MIRLAIIAIVAVLAVTLVLTATRKASKPKELLIRLALGALIVVLAGWLWFGVDGGLGYEAAQFIDGEIVPAQTQ